MNAKKKRYEKVRNGERREAVCCGGRERERARERERESERERERENLSVYLLWCVCVCILCVRVYVCVSFHMCTRVYTGVVSRYPFPRVVRFSSPKPFLELNPS